MSACLEEQPTLIRPLQVADLEGVAEIEKASYPFPWSGGIFADCLRVGYSCWVLEFLGQLAGYSIASHGAGEAHLLNLCVSARYRNLGAGLELLDWVISQARKAECGIIFLEVRPSNHRAIKIYQQRGFLQIGVRPNYYPAVKGREDAIIMAYQLEDESRA